MAERRSRAERRRPATAATAQLILLLLERTELVDQPLLFLQQSRVLTHLLLGVLTAVDAGGNPLARELRRPRAHFLVEGGLPLLLRRLALV